MSSGEAPGAGAVARQTGGPRSGRVPRCSGAGGGGGGGGAPACGENRTDWARYVAAARTCRCWATAGAAC